MALIYRMKLVIKLKADTQVAAKIDVFAVAENFWWRFDAIEIQVGR